MNIPRGKIQFNLLKLYFCKQEFAFVSKISPMTHETNHSSFLINKLLKTVFSK